MTKTQAKNLIAQQALEQATTTFLGQMAGPREWPEAPGKVSIHRPHSAAQTQAFKFLGGYIIHHKDCAAMGPCNQAPCSCGLWDAMDRFNEATWAKVPGKLA